MTEVNKLKNLVAKSLKPCESTIIITRQKRLDIKKAKLKITIDII
jgi:hypothetical protein